MRVFIASCLAVAVLATIAGFVLPALNKPVDLAYTAPGVRL
jgi:hypothetical protein